LKETVPEPVWAVADELGDDNLALQRRRKPLFDPHRILNPGKAL
jgi:FAD/FMN-containing dehydrogenase